MGGGGLQAAAPGAVAIYIRWSTDEQTEGTTLEVQLERCTLFIRSQGWEVHDDLIFVDEGYSGGSLDRPALTRLRQAVRMGEVDCVVSYSVDRLSRNLADIVELVQNEWAGRAVFRSASQPISTEEGNPAGQLVFNILASFAEFERGLIRERTSSGLVRRAKQGKYPGSRVAPMGYRRDGTGTLAIDDTGPDGSLSGPALVVRQIFAMALTGPYGQGATAIARHLNSMAIASPCGGKWFAGSVRWILRNPVYAGTVVYGRRKTNPQHQRDKSTPRMGRRSQPLASVENSTPAIVAKADWERVQQLEAERAAPHRKGVQNANRALLTGLVRCVCGGPLTINHKGERRFYRCIRHALGGACTFEPGHYNVDQIEAAVVAEVKARYGSAELRATALAKVMERSRIDDRREGLLQALREVDVRARTVEGDVSRLRRAAREGEIQLKTYEELKADADAELANLSARRSELEAQLVQMNDTSMSVEAWKHVLAQVDLWDTLDLTRQREMLFGLIRRVRVYRKRKTRGPIAVDIMWEEPLSGNVAP